MRKILLPIIILIGAVAGAFALVANKDQPAQEEITESSILVEVMLPQARDSYIRVSSQGTVEPRTRTNIVSEVSGRVIEVSPAFVAGGFFRTGDVLLRLDDQNYRAAVSRDAAALAFINERLQF